MATSYLVTGAQGCIGGWVVKTLVQRGDRAVVFDLSAEPRRMQQIMSAAELSQVRFVQGDVTDLDALEKAIGEHGVTRIIHLAGLQVPFCKADPALGARVNVLGTIQVFEAARRAGLTNVVYASSAGVYGPMDDEAPVDEAVACEPTTHYGVYKRANEGNARVYYLDQGLSSVGLRPLTVYGVGRDQGLTSGPTRAMKAAVVEQAFTIGFSGATDFLYVGDAARAFIDCADRAPEGAHVFNLHGESTSVERVVSMIAEHSSPAAASQIRIEGQPIPIAAAMDDGAYRKVMGVPELTPLSDGVQETMQRFRQLHEAGNLSLEDLRA